MKRAAIKAEFVSTLNPQGTLLTGTFTQKGIKFALTLQRQESVAAVRRPQTPQAPFPYDSADIAFVAMLAGPGVRGGDLVRAQGELFRQASPRAPAPPSPPQR